MSASDLSTLFAGAGLEDDAVAALDLTVDNLGDAIMAGLGDVGIDAIEQLGATEVLLLRLLIDDSSSISYEHNADLVINGHNQVLDALLGSKASGTILVSCQFLNHGVLYPFVPLEQAVRMTSSNYHPTGSTPLYDMTAATLSSVVAKMTELEDGGVAVRGVTYIITDGADYGSRTHRPATVEAIVRGMLRSENHIIGAMGIDDHSTDFRAVFGAMGIPNQWILTPTNNPSEIRRAFGTISQSAVRASQAVGSFSQTALGGFGTDS
ncbi:MAG TPA: hypothetical protein VLF91_04645 [Candidatus Saccharimonadales bacterium]|nr:hypothetical protein [Candidatus Saccharimonadales bacterium]